MGQLQGSDPPRLVRHSIAWGQVEQIGYWKRPTEAGKLGSFRKIQKLNLLGIRGPHGGACI
jgi:hypothetical protein